VSKALLVPTVRSSAARSARRARRRLPATWCLCALATAGCATAVGLQKDGTYVLERTEQSLDCQRLANSVWGRLQVLRSLPDRARAERQAVAPTAVAAWGRLFGGSSKGLPSLEEYDRERAHVRALHRVMLDKGCTPIDIERELALADSAIAEYRQ
jgi:hypothetical protein